MMNINQLIHPNDRFFKSLRASVVAHIVLLLFLIIKASFFAGEPIKFQNAIRVDMVALPDKIKPQAEAPPAIAKTETTKAPAETKESTSKTLPNIKKIDPTKVNLDKSKTKEDDALKALEALRKLKEMSKSNTPPSAKAANETKTSKQVFKGEVLSPGSAISGLNKIDYDSYLGDLDNKVKNNWSLPKFLAQKQLSASIMIFIDKNGQLVKKYIKRSSGNSLFDEKCMLAVENSAPFDPPPYKLEAILETDGIELGFPE